MKRFWNSQQSVRKQWKSRQTRRGAFIVVACLCLVGVLGFVALSIDLGVVSLTKTRMQNAVDAAALAAAQEIQVALEEIAVEGGSVDDASEIAMNAAKLMAADVAERNGVYVNAEVDVRFGRRAMNEAGEYVIQWDTEPFNVVEVKARKDNDSAEAPDAKLDLFFAPVLGHDSTAIQASAIAFVESRDIVVVADFSGSMSYDSEFQAMAPERLGKANVEENWDNIWDTLVESGVTFSNDTSKVKFPSTGFGGVNSAVGTSMSSNNDDTIFNSLNLGATDSSGKLLFPFPQEGRNTGNGSLKGKPSATTSKNLWKGYINWVRTNSEVNTYGYRKKYGYRTLMAYLIQNRKENFYSEDLWMAQEYPIHAQKQGISLLCEFLGDLEFGDHMGFVTYDSTARVETGLNDDGVEDTVDLGDELITGNHAGINMIQLHRQAGHYAQYTATGDGIRVGTDLLQSHGRYGARPTLLVMTDGNANRYPTGWTMPLGWNWNELTDYNDDGIADYITGDISKMYAFYQAKRAIDAGYTIHTMTVGSNADRNLMKAIAHAGGGIWIDVPGGSNVSEMESQMLEAFARIAANVPPAKLLIDPNAE